MTLIQCAKSEWHGHHDADSPCPYCEPPKTPVVNAVIKSIRVGTKAFDFETSPIQHGMYEPPALIGSPPAAAGYGNAIADWPSRVDVPCKTHSPRPAAEKLAEFQALIDAGVLTYTEAEKEVGHFLHDEYVIETPARYYVGEYDAALRARIQDALEEYFAKPRFRVPASDVPVGSSAVRIVGTDVNGDRVEEDVTFDEKGYYTSKNSYRSASLEYTAPLAYAPEPSTQSGWSSPSANILDDLELTAKAVRDAERTPVDFFGKPIVPSTYVDVEAWLSTHEHVVDYRYYADPGEWDVDLDDYAHRDAFRAAFAAKFPGEGLDLYSPPPIDAYVERRVREAMGMNPADPVKASMAVFSAIFADHDSFLVVSNDDEG